MSRLKMFCCPPRPPAVRFFSLPSCCLSFVFPSHTVHLGCIYLHLTLHLFTSIGIVARSRCAAQCFCALCFRRYKSAQLYNVFLPHVATTRVVISRLIDNNASRFRLQPIQLAGSKCYRFGGHLHAYSRAPRRRNLYPDGISEI